MLQSTQKTSKQVDGTEECAAGPAQQGRACATLRWTTCNVVGVQRSAPAGKQAALVHLPDQEASTGGVPLVPPARRLIAPCSQVHNEDGKKRVVITKTLPGERWLQLLISTGCRVEVCTAEKTILSNADIKQLIGDKCDGVIGQLTEVRHPCVNILGTSAKLRLTCHHGRPPAARRRNFISFQSIPPIAHCRAGTRTCSSRSRQQAVRRTAITPSATTTSMCLQPQSAASPSATHRVGARLLYDKC